MIFLADGPSAWIGFQAPYEKLAGTVWVAVEQFSIHTLYVYSVVASCECHYNERSWLHFPGFLWIALFIGAGMTNVGE